MKQEILVTGEGTAYEWSNDHIFVKTTGAVTDGRAAMVVDTLKPGFHLARHHHKKMSEIFYILAGEVTFIFDDETIVATVGTAINVPPNVWHEAHTASGATMLSVFSPAGFEDYLAEMATLTDEQFTDAAFMTALNEKYDIWNS